MHARLVTLVVVGAFTISGCESQESKARAILGQHEKELLKLEESAAFDAFLRDASRGYREQGNMDMSGLTGALGVEATEGTLRTRETLGRLFREEFRMQAYRTRWGNESGRSGFRGGRRASEERGEDDHE